MKTITVCPSCKNNELKFLLETKDFFLSQENFILVQCTTCKLVITNPQPDTFEIAEYYKSDNYISHKNESTSIFDVIYKLARSYSVRSKLDIINSLKLDRTILDYGCGTGTFLQSCKKNSWVIDGVEPNAQAREIASKNLNTEVKSDLSNITNPGYYSVITLWHVLEHVHDLNNCLSQIHTLLREKGKLIIAVPNHESYDAQLFKKHWAAYDVPRHLFHFSRTSIEALLNKNNFFIDRVLPMKFDSFYISLLSEQYATSRKRWLKSLISGYKSNIYGKKTGNYSSLIYVASKC